MRYIRLLACNPAQKIAYTVICLLSLFTTALPAGTLPNIAIITVDTLRSDHLGAYGYPYATSPNIDSLLAQGVVFTQARTPEPLTAPALISMFTSLYPHEHGATRNGLRQRPDLPSVSKILAARGYQTAAIISNWTLKDRLTGMAHHFGEYREVLEQKRWFGLFLSESDALDITSQAIGWLETRKADKPFFLWAHYADPHAPYQLHKEFSTKLGIKGEATRIQRYDSEIAFTDANIGSLLKSLPQDTLIIFASDHGESLGEQDYWGHGRLLNEASLRVPLAMIWRGKIKPGTITYPAMLLDISPTLLSLINLPIPDSFRGFNWSPAFEGKTPRPGRTMFFQAHKGAVQSKAGAANGRIKGLVGIGVIKDDGKEVFRIRSRTRKLFQLREDPKELNSLVKARSDLSPELRKWAQTIENGLRTYNKAPKLEETDIEKLRSLGYID